MTRVRCKFLCESIEPAYPNLPDQPGRVVTMGARWEPQIPEDERFTKATPGGTLRVQIDNPVALEVLKVGGFYYLDLSPAE